MLATGCLAVSRSGGNADVRLPGLLGEVKRVWSNPKPSSRSKPNALSGAVQVVIDSKLRGRDVVALQADDLAPGGYADDRAIIRQMKTGRPIKF